MQMTRQFFIMERIIKFVNAISKKTFPVSVKWLQYNGMFLNANETKTIYFGSKRKIQNNIFCIHYSDNVLDSVESMTYLGVTLDKSNMVAICKKSC